MSSMSNNRVLMVCVPLQEPALYTGSSVLDRQPDTAQCCLAVAFKGAAWTDPDSIPLMVMQTLLGGWDRNNTSGKHAGAVVRGEGSRLRDGA
jgi:processing peptidase subunit beta